MAYPSRKSNPPKSAKDEEVTSENLKKVDAVVLGVRAINTNERLLFQAPILLDYVKNGGTMVVQYNTTVNVRPFSPFELTLSNDRVTEENAAAIMAAGADVLVAGNTVFKSADPKKTIRVLKTSDRAD